MDGHNVENEICDALLITFISSLLLTPRMDIFSIMDLIHFHENIL